MALRRSLHWVFKIGDRSATLDFYKNVLGMKVLRHEEFNEGCDAACNGPYDGRWSKTMIGYGSEDSHFVVELTYNYGISSYEIGNDFKGLFINSKDVYKRARELNLGENTSLGLKICAPDGYPFYIGDDDVQDDPVQGIYLACHNLTDTEKYWKDYLGMTKINAFEDSVTLGFEQGVFLKFVEQPGINRAKAYGRVAFSLPIEQLRPLESSVKEAGYQILTPFITLATPGKADVSVVIFSDPNQHEICFVGDEAFRELSEFDPNADEALELACREDKSNEWFAKKGKSKSSS